MKVFACFVTYYPDPDRFRAAYDSVVSQVEKVIIVDNTEHNEGIATALNKAFEQAESEGCDYLLTLDQDSIVPSNLVQKLVADFDYVESAAQIGPLYSVSQNYVAGISKADFLITSGAMTSVSAWRKVGGFDKSYFIDYVDHEFSLKLRKSGFNIYKDNSLLLDHQLGCGLVGWNILGKKRLGYIDHVPVRWYYMTRNCCRLCADYSQFFPLATRFLKKSMIKMVIRLLLNGKDRIPRVKMILKGYSDYRNNISGEILL